MEQLSEWSCSNDELYDFELGNGQEDDWVDQAGEIEELRRVILFLAEERNSFMAKLRGLHALGQVLRGDAKRERGGCDMSVCDGDEIDGIARGQEAESPVSKVTEEPRAFDHFQGGFDERSSKKENQNIIKGPDREFHARDELLPNGDDSILKELAQTNHELQIELDLLHRLIQDQDKDSDKVFPKLRSEVARFATRTRKLERALRTKDVLCHSLAEQIDVMKDRIHQTKSARLTNSMSEKATTKQGEVLNNAKVGAENTDTQAKPQERSHEPLGTELSHHTDGKQFMMNQQNLGKNIKISAGDEGEVINSEETVSRIKYDCLMKEVNEVKKQLEDVTVQKEKLQEHVEESQAQHDKEQEILRMQIGKLEQNCKHYQDVISQFHANEQSRKREVDQLLLQAKDCLERERLEKFSSISEQKSLRQQLENMSKSMKNMQVKNEEFVRFHCDQEDQVEDFKRLKKMIQENGLPTIEQMISLQRQNETFREDLLNERKEKERLSSLKDKLKRDLDQSQSRISSLQEQVYKYREHIFFLQQKFKQEQGGLGSPGLGPPSSPLFEDTVNQPPLLSGANKLYGSSAPQYINKQVLHGSVPPKYPLMPMSEKKQGSGRHGDGQAGKPWQYQQGQYGKFGRQMSLDDWKRGPPGQGPQPPHQQPWETYYNSAQSQPSRLSSSSKSGSSVGSLEDMAENGHEQPSFAHSPRRQGPRPTLTERSSSEDSRGMMQGYGAPQQSAFEGWQPKQGFHMNRNQRRYSSPINNGHGIRSPTAEFWPQQQIQNFPRAWQDSSPYQDPPISTPTGLRPGADPWLPTSQYSPSSSQSQVSTTSYGDTGTYMSAGFSSR